jgi:hypothetical protein
VLVPGAAVGAVGTPVKAGLANNAPPAAVISDACRVIAPVRVLNEITELAGAPIKSEYLPVNATVDNGVATHLSTV